MEQWKWHGVQAGSPRTYICGHCGKVVGSDRYFYPEGIGGDDPPRIYVCPFCSKPSFFYGKDQIPGVAYGNSVENLTIDVGALWTEARNAMSVNAHTSAVMVCRKILMNLAVGKGAEQNESFAFYVDYLAQKGYVPPGGEEWVGHIRQKGNEANHEIKLMSPEDAKELMGFTEMFLKFVFEFPGKIAARKGAAGLSTT